MFWEKKKTFWKVPLLWSCGDEFHFQNKNLVHQESLSGTPPLLCGTLLTSDPRAYHHHRPFPTTKQSFQTCYDNDNITWYLVFLMLPFDETNSAMLAPSESKVRSLMIFRKS